MKKSTRPELITQVLYKAIKDITAVECFQETDNLDLKEFSIFVGEFQENTEICN